MSDKFQNNNVDNQETSISIGTQKSINERFRFCLNKTLIRWFCLSLTLGIVVLGNINLTFAQQTQPYSWGWNGYGQLGDGTNTDRKTPGQVSGLTNVTAVAAGYKHSLMMPARKSVAYIEGYYNRIRRHSSLGYLSPLEFEKQLKIKNQRSSESFLSCFS